MTAETLAQRCARELRERAARIHELTEEVQRLRDDNKRVWASREEWKEKHRGRETELSVLRRSVKRLKADRDKWRGLAAKRQEKLYNYRRNGKAPWHNVRLSESDVARIMEIPPR